METPLFYTFHSEQLKKFAGFLLKFWNITLHSCEFKKLKKIFFGSSLVLSDKIMFSYCCFIQLYLTTQILVKKVKNRKYVCAYMFNLA